MWAPPTHSLPLSGLGLGQASQWWTVPWSPFNCKEDHHCNSTSIKLSAVYRHFCIHHLISPSLCPRGKQAVECWRRLPWACESQWCPCLPGSTGSGKSGKSAIMGGSIYPWKLANTTNQSFLGGEGELVSEHKISTPLVGQQGKKYFSGEKTEAQRGEVTCRGPHS